MNLIGFEGKKVRFVILVNTLIPDHFIESSLSKGLVIPVSLALPHKKTLAIVAKGSQQMIANYLKNSAKLFDYGAAIFQLVFVGTGSAAAIFYSKYSIDFELRKTLPGFGEPLFLFVDFHLIIPGSAGAFRRSAKLSGGQELQKLRYEV